MQNEGILHSFRLKSLKLRSVFIRNLYHFLSIWLFWFTDGSFELTNDIFSKIIIVIFLKQIIIPSLDTKV